MPTALEANAAAFLAVAVLGVSLLLAIVSALSWNRLRHPKLALVALAFGALALKGGLATFEALQGRPGDLVGSGLDLAVVLLLYASVAQR